MLTPGHSRLVLASLRGTPASYQPHSGVLPPRTMLTPGYSRLVPCSLRGTPASYQPHSGVLPPRTMLTPGFSRLVSASLRGTPASYQPHSGVLPPRISLTPGYSRLAPSTQSLRLWHQTWYRVEKHHLLSCSALPDSNMAESVSIALARYRRFTSTPAPAPLISAKCRSPQSTAAEVSPSGQYLSYSHTPPPSRNEDKHQTW